MALNSSGIQVGAAAIAADINKLTLHTGDPGASGTANVTTAASQAVVCTSANGNVTVPQTAFAGGAASGPCTYVAVWNGPTYRGSYALTGDQAFNSAGNYTVTSITINGTGS